MRLQITWSKVSALFCASVSFLLLAATPSRADGISFQVTAATLTAASNGTATFTGAITNSSGADLNATDFFFNFLNFDPTSVTPNQLLGTSTDFSIGDGTTTSILDLFNVQLGSVSAGSTFLIDVQLQDANGDLSAVETVDVNVSGGSTGGGGNGGGGGTTTTPEPTTLLLLGSGLAFVGAWRKRLIHSS
jgi:hypothetical protein